MTGESEQIRNPDRVVMCGEKVLSVVRIAGLPGYMRADRLIEVIRVYKGTCVDALEHCENIKIKNLMILVNFE